MMTEKQVWPEATFRVKVRLKKHKTQGQMLADFSEAVIAKRAEKRPTLPPIPEGFIPHDGGPCPVAKGVLIEAVFRDGETGKARSNVLHWGHYCRGNDIIAYRPERSPDFRVEAGRFYITQSGERVGPMRKLIGGLFDAGWHNHRVWKMNGAACAAAAMRAMGNQYSDLIALAADQTSPVGATCQR